MLVLNFKSPKFTQFIQREGIVLEMAFFRVRRGLIEDAYEHLRAYIIREPYRQNPLFHGEKIATGLDSNHLYMDS